MITKGATSIVLVLFLYAIKLSAQNLCSLQPIVFTTSGQIYGKNEALGTSLLQVYYGIPYAEPPIGDRRFQAPEPISPWSNPLQATKFAPACVQHFTYPYPWKDFDSPQSEDCLYLNVFVPNCPSGKLKKAVMFFVHGGSYITGSSRMPEYNARALAVEGDVIVVTFNYRLGVLGFLYADIPDAPGNAGFRDTILALKWVNENIKFFGGDEKMITVFGSSAGAMSVGLLTVSPVSNSLFKRAILQDASPAVYFSNLKEQVFEIGEQVADAVNCSVHYTLKNNPNEVVKCLKGIDALNLQIASSIVTKDQFTWFPMHGDDILPKDPRKAIINKDFKSVDLLIGCTKDDGSFFLTEYDPQRFGFLGDKNAYFDKPYAINFIQNYYGEFPGTSTMVKHYVGDDNLEPDRLRRMTYTAAGDFLFSCPAIYYAEKSAEMHSNVYFYHFTDRPSTSKWAPWMGTVHAEELEYVFGMPLIYPQLYTDAEFDLSNKIVKIWSNFAKTGNPGYTWPYFSKDNPEVFVLNRNNFGNITRAPSKENCDVMRSSYGF